MDSDRPWISYYDDRPDVGIVKSDWFAELGEEDDETGGGVCLESILPDDVLEKILGFLPAVSIILAGSVSKRWNRIVSSKGFQWGPITIEKPWYFMFTGSNDPDGYAYDPTLKKWYAIDLPCVDKSNWFVSSSRGLVCFMDNDSQRGVYVCNPITRYSRKVDEPPDMTVSDYTSIAIAVKRCSKRYSVSVVKAKQEAGSLTNWVSTIKVYDSESASWRASLTEVMTGWRSGDESVICDGVLYVMFYSASIGATANRHSLISYDMSVVSSHGLLKRSGCFPAPCSLTSARLMNLRERLFMVGGLGKMDRPGVIRGVGVWILEKRDWRMIDRMPAKLFHGFGEFDDVFTSSGMDELIYVQSYGSPSLLVFDVNKRQWKWSHRSPVEKPFPLQTFTGFSFEPRIDIAP